MKRTHYRSLADYLAKTKTRQEDFAARVGLRQGYVSRIARGLIVPRADLRQRIAQAARCSVDSFIREKVARRQASNHRAPAEARL